MQFRTKEDFVMSLLKLGCHGSQQRGISTVLLVSFIPLFGLVLMFLKMQL